MNQMKRGQMVLVVHAGESARDVGRAKVVMPGLTTGGAAGRRRSAGRPHPGRGVTVMPAFEVPGDRDGLGGLAESGRRNTITGACRPAEVDLLEVGRGGEANIRPARKRQVDRHHLRHRVVNQGPAGVRSPRTTLNTTGGKDVAIQARPARGWSRAWCRTLEHHGLPRRAGRTSTPTIIIG